MKKLYLPLFATLVSYNIASAQPMTLLAAYHEPDTGDVRSYQQFDSSGVIPRSGGLSQNWNFSNFTLKAGSARTETYVIPSAVSGGSNYAGAYLALDQGPDGFLMLGRNATALYVVGFGGSGVNYTLTSNPALMKWPFTYNTTYTDNITGIGPLNTTVTGVVAVTGTGNGDLVLPGGQTLNNVLQVRTVLSITITNGSTVNEFDHNTSYEYYHTTQKFPVMRVEQSDNYISVEVNKNNVVGIEDNKQLSSLFVYPNPSFGEVFVQVPPVAAGWLKLSVLDATGRTLHTRELQAGGSHHLDLELSSGLYFVLVSGPEGSYSKPICITR